MQLSNATTGRHLTHLRSAGSYAGRADLAMGSASNRCAGQLLQIWIVCAAICCMSTAGPAHSAELQTTFAQALPEDLGLRLPVGAVQSGSDRRVIANDLNGDAVVGKVHAQVEDHLVVLLPTGRLISVPELETTSTDRPFEPIDKADFARRLLSTNFKGFKSRKTKRYLYIYNSSEPFTNATSRILETMYPGLYNYCRRQKLPVHTPEFPLVVVIFRTQEEFDRFYKMPPGVVAYYNTISNQVVMYEQSRLADMAPELAIKQSISTIAHEGAHQILHNIGVQQRLSRWPIWISEGLAEYFAPTETKKKRVRWKGVGLVNDLRMYELSNFLKKHGTSNGCVLRELVEAETLNSLGYANSWALVNYLTRFRSDKFVGFLRAVAQLKPLQDVDPDDLFRQHFGDDFMKLETAVIKYLNSLSYADPVENQTHFVALSKNAQQILMTTSPMKARQFQSRYPNTRIQAFPSRQMARQFYDTWSHGRK